MVIKEHDSQGGSILLITHSLPFLHVRLSRDSYNLLMRFQICVYLTDNISAKTRVVNTIMHVSQDFGGARVVY